MAEAQERIQKAREDLTNLFNTLKNALEGSGMGIETFKTLGSFLDSLKRMTKDLTEEERQALKPFVESKLEELCKADRSVFGDVLKEDLSVLAIGVCVDADTEDELVKVTLPEEDLERRAKIIAALDEVASGFIEDPRLLQPLSPVPLDEILNKYAASEAKCNLIHYYWMKVATDSLKKSLVGISDHAARFIASKIIAEDSKLPLTVSTMIRKRAIEEIGKTYGVTDVKLTASFS